MNTIRILLADDHTVMRAGLRLLLERQPDMTVVAEAEDGRQTVELADSHTPDIVVLDIAMPNLNGIEAARELAKNPSNTVILLGGVLRVDGMSINVPLGESFLDTYHIKTAFLSCSGFTLESGLTEVDIYEAQIKRKMIASSGAVVALIDSSKFGRMDLTPFASIAQLVHIYTDDHLGPEWVEQLLSSQVPFTLCGEDKD